MTLNLEGEDITSRKWWKQTHNEIEKAKEEFIRSGKIGGNPLGIADNALKKNGLKELKK